MFAMPDKPKQPTQPAKGEPVEIPVPSREDVMRDLKKTAQPVDTPSSGRRSDDG